MEDTRMNQESIDHGKKGRDPVPFVLVLVWLTFQSSVLMLPQIVRAQPTINMWTSRSTYNVGDEVLVYWDSSNTCIQAVGSVGELDATGPYGPLRPTQLSRSDLMGGYWDLGSAGQTDIGSWTITLTVSSSEYPECESSGSVSFPVIGGVTCASVTITSSTKVTTTITSATEATITRNSYYYFTVTTTNTIRGADLTFPQMIATAAATATIVAVAFHIYVGNKPAMIRITERRTTARPGLAFGVDVKSGVDREESSG